MTLGERIKYHRERAGMTQEEVARMLDTSPQNIYKYEKGIVTNIPLKNLEAMAVLFQIAPSELAGWTEEKPSPNIESGHSKEAIEFAKAHADLTKEEWRMLASYAQALRDMKKDTKNNKG